MLFKKLQIYFNKYTIYKDVIYNDNIKEGDGVI